MVISAASFVPITMSTVSKRVQKDEISVVCEIEKVERMGVTRKQKCLLSTTDHIGGIFDIGLNAKSDCLTTWNHFIIAAVPCVDRVQVLIWPSTLYLYDGFSVMSGSPVAAHPWGKDRSGGTKDEMVAMLF